MGSHQNGTEMGTLSVVFTSLLEEVVHSMLSKIVSLACVALTAGQVQVAGSPEWQAYKTAELAFVAPSVGPTPVNYEQSALNFVGPAPGPSPVNYEQSALDFVAPAPGPSPVSYAQSTLNYQQEALNFIASGLGK